jgi:hypothetical protein
MVKMPSLPPGPLPKRRPEPNEIELPVRFYVVDVTNGRLCGVARVERTYDKVADIMTWRYRSEDAGSLNTAAKKGYLDFGLDEHDA